MAVAVALVALVAATAVGCGADEATRPPAASTTGAAPGDPTEVPSAFALAGPDGWGLVGATDDLLVGLGGGAADEDRFGQTFDLETGAVADLPPPPFEEGREVVVDWMPLGRATAAFGTGTVVVGAFAFEAGVDPDEVDITTGEPPSTLLTYRLDPAAGTWTPLALPARYAGTPRLSLKALAPTGDDGAVAVLDGGITQEALLVRLQGDAWVPVTGAGLADPLASETCATDTALWQLASDVADAELTALALDDGAPLPVSGPARLADGEWEVAHIGCTADAVVVALSGSSPEGGGERRPPAVLVSRDGTSWDELVDPYGEGGDWVGGTTSGAAAVIVHAGGMEPAPSGQPIVVTSGAEAVPLDADLRDRTTWRGRTGTYLVLPGHADDGSHPGDDRPTVPLRQVEVG